MTLAAVMLQLAEEEGRDLINHADISLHPEVSPLILISSGLDLEDLQYVQLVSLNTKYGLNRRKAPPGMRCGGPGDPRNRSAKGKHSGTSKRTAKKDQLVVASSTALHAISRITADKGVFGR
ncbi:hypothetical protein JVT61DRAFT_11768 [Boletus reticuloceps]|uniref:Uncharacterized protein n=1 Tax=Boletus reticuloceps TaxID=495285 RepID=A0A8I2YZB3_9AGAM|nr:hypothetical protein JVT61DRAFT_11768 [Boletus reticuloceps]